jgi:hypothetical protein
MMSYSASILPLQKPEGDGIILPSNIIPGNFIHAVADNINISEETLDGKKTTHATSLVLYQRQEEITGRFSTPLEHFSDKGYFARSKQGVNLCHPQLSV